MHIHGAIKLLRHGTALGAYNGKSVKYVQLCCCYITQGGQKKRGGKTTSGNGQAWSLPSPRGQWRTEKTWRKQVVKPSLVPQVKVKDVTNSLTKFCFTNL